MPETLEASLQLSEAALVDLGVAMGPVIASIHEKRDELRAEIKAEAELGRIAARLGAAAADGIRSAFSNGSKRSTPAVVGSVLGIVGGMALPVVDDHLAEIERRDAFEAGDVDAQLVGVRAALVVGVDAADRCRNDARRRPC